MTFYAKYCIILLESQCDRKSKEETSMSKNEFTNKSSAVILRRETTTRLELTTHPDLRNAITHACEKFIKLPMNDANRTAFEMIYLSNDTKAPIMMTTDLKKLGLTLHMSQDLFLITPEQATIIGHEMVFQYMSRSPNFLSLHKTDGCETEHEELSKALGNEPVLLFAIYMAANRTKKRSKKDVERIVNLLQSKKLEEQYQGIIDFQEAPSYRSAMKPYAPFIGKLLMAIYRQRTAEGQFVMQEKVPEIKFAAEHNIPQHLLNEVPALTSVAPIIQLRDTIRSFCKEHEHTLKSLRAMNAVGVKIQVFLELEAPTRADLSTLKIPNAFSSKLHAIVANTYGDKVDLGQFIVCLEQANVLLDAYAELKKAHDMKMQAASSFEGAFQKVQSHTSATTAMQVDVKALDTAIQTSLDAEATLTQKSQSFQMIVSNHFQELPKKN